MTLSNEPEGVFSDEDVDMTDAPYQAPPEKPPAEQAAAPDALPVVNLQQSRVPDQNDVVLDNVIVGRHSEADMRAAIAASNRPLLERVKEALAPI